MSKHRPVPVDLPPIPPTTIVPAILPDGPRFTRIGGPEQDREDAEETQVDLYTKLPVAPLD